MILVTGGAGFIGSALIKELNKIGRSDIIIVDRLRDSTKWLNLRSLKYENYIYADDFFDIADDEDLYNQIDFIFHIGACSSTTMMDMDYLMVNNVEYSKELFKVASERDIPFIYASSAATYGGGENGYSDDHEKIKDLLPLNPYGYSKQVFDEWVLKQKDYPKFWYGLKFFNVFGPNEYHKEEMRSLVHKAYGQIKKDSKVKLFKSHREDFEDGKQLRDFIYVKDVVAAMLRMMNGSIETSGIYNLGTGKARSFLDLITAVFNAQQIPVNIEFIDMPLEIRDQYQYYTQADMTKFQKNFSDFNFTELEESVQDYVMNYLSKENSYY